MRIITQYEIASLNSLGEFPAPLWTGVIRLRIMRGMDCLHDVVCDARETHHWDIPDDLRASNISLTVQWIQDD